MSKNIPQFERVANSDFDEVSKPFFGNGFSTTNGKSGHNNNPFIIDDRSEEDRRCGFGFYSPEWLQQFASKKWFMLIFSGLAIIQGMAWAYFTATITTLEKRFKISSETAGIVMTGNEISQILFSVVLSYYGGKGHRPRWIATGILFSALSAFILAAPHILYGPGSDALSLTEEYAHLYEDVDHLRSSNGSFLSAIQNMTSKGSAAATRNKVQTCRRYTDGGDSTQNDCAVADTSIVPLILIFLSQFVLGIGVLLFFALGGPYLDDNVDNTKTPFVFGLTMSLRLIGPTFGFMLAGACLKMYISPWLTPVITTSDPRWMGAWWLGWVILGFVMAFTSVFIAMFPKELPRTTLRRKLKGNMAAGALGHTGSVRDVSKAGSQLVLTAELVADNAMPKIEELPKALKSLFSNKINVLNTTAGIFYMFAGIGYWTYMPKYMETIFRQTAVNASVISGTVSIAFQSIGLLVSGALISKFRPSARKLAAWNVILGLLYVAVKVSFTQLGCDQGNLMLGTENVDRTWNLTEGCNMDCNCKVNKMLPVCYKEKNQVWYSACHAGCSSLDGDTISECSCLPNLEEKVTLGTCADSGCLAIFLTFLGINAFIKLLDSSGRIGNMLVAYRCVDPQDKSLAIGLTIFLTSVFAFLPAPIVFGKIFDSVCLVWGTKCGERGNCWLYDGERLRYRLNLVTAGFTLVGTILDAFVWYYVKDLDLYDEQKNIEARAKEKKEKNEGLRVLS